MSTEPDDLQACEHCGKEFPIEQCSMMSDCWFCQGCTIEWKAHFDACEHEWRLDHDEFGDAAAIATSAAASSWTKASEILRRAQ